MLEGDTAVMLLFDHRGKIAGIQNGVSFHILLTFRHSFGEMVNDCLGNDDDYSISRKYSTFCILFNFFTLSP